MSITANASQLVLNALLARLKNESVFTVKDVTNDARDMTTYRDNIIDHPEVQTIVHNEFSTGQFPPNWNQNSIELNVDGNPVAIVYYPDGKDALDHPLALNGNGGAVAQVQVQSAPTSSVPTVIQQVQTTRAANAAPKQGGNTKDGDSFICETTSEGRINVPRVLTDKIKAGGGTYDVNVVGGSILYKKPNTDGRLRISASEVGGGTKFRLDVDASTNIITIEQL